MNRDYTRWYSPTLGRDMEMLVFGHAGTPLLVFPSSMGKFFEYEDRGMVAALAGPVDSGALTLYCVDSADAESWYNKRVHPRIRVLRHIQYERYILDEVLPLVRHRSGGGRLAVTGCSFGGFHCVNFAFRHPELVSHCVSISAAFDNWKTLLAGRAGKPGVASRSAGFAPTASGANSVASALGNSTRRDPGAACATIT